MSKFNYEKAVKIYAKGGQYAVYDAVESGELYADSMRDCLPCEDRTPHDGDTCLVCGTDNPRPHQNLAHSIRFDDVDSMVLWLLDNNVDETPVTLTIHLGDAK